MAIIQITGVFLASWFGLVSTLRAMKGQNVPTFNFFVFALGMAMALSKLFL